MTHSTNCQFSSSRLAAVAFTLFALFASPIFAQSSTRIWSDNSGTFSVEAELTGWSDTAVSLKKLNGVMIQVPISKLSQIDNDYVKKQMDKRVAISLIEKPAPTTTPTQTAPPSPSLAKENLEPASPLRSTSSTTDDDRTVKRTAFGNDSSSSVELPKVTNNPATTFHDHNVNSSPDSSSLSLNPPTDQSSLQLDMFPKPNFSSPALATNNGLGQRDSLNIVETESGRLFRKNMAVNKDRREFKTVEMSELNINRLINSISDLQDRNAVRSGLQTLSSTWPSSQTPGIVAAIRSCMKSTDYRSRELALDLLAIHDARDSIDLITAGIDDDNFDIRWAAYEWVKELRDPQSVETLCKKLLSDDRDQAATILESFGPAVERFAAPYVNAESTEAQMTACSLLAKIGTQHSLPALQKTAADAKTMKVRMQARNAIESIQRRLRVASANAK